MTRSTHDRRRPAHGLAAVLFLAVALMAACSDGRPTAGEAPSAGDLQVALDAGSGEMGAVQFDITGGEIGEIVAVHPEHALFTRRSSATSVSVAIVGESLAGPLVRFEVPDVRAAGRYAVALIEMADRDNRIVPSIEAPRVIIARTTP